MTRPQAVENLIGAAKKIDQLLDHYSYPLMSCGDFLIAHQILKDALRLNQRPALAADQRATNKPTKKAKAGK